MMAKENIFVGGIKIGPVFQAIRRCAAPVVQFHDVPGQKPSVKPIGQDVETRGRDDEPEPIHFFMRIEEADNMAKCDGTEDG